MSAGGDKLGSEEIAGESHSGERGHLSAGRGESRAGGHALGNDTDR